MRLGTFLAREPGAGAAFARVVVHLNDAVCSKPRVTAVFSRTTLPPVHLGILGRIPFPSLLFVPFNDFLLGASVVLATALPDPLQALLLLLLLQKQCSGGLDSLNKNCLTVPESRYGSEEE